MSCANGQKPKGVWHYVGLQQQQRSAAYGEYHPFFFQFHQPKAKSIILMISINFDENTPDNSP